MVPTEMDDDIFSTDENHHDDPEEADNVWTAERLWKASYKDLGTPAQVEDLFRQHLLASHRCRTALRALLRASSRTTRDYSITVDTFDLLRADPVLGYMLLRYPTTLLPLLENAIIRAQEDLLREHQSNSSSSGQDNNNVVETEEWVVKGRQTGQGVALSTRVHARLVHLPPYCCKTSLASMQADDVGQIWQVTGTVVRTGPVEMYESARTYQCCRGRGGGGGSRPRSGSARPEAREESSSQAGPGGRPSLKNPQGCGRTFVVHADMEQRNNALQTPEHCPLLLEGTHQRCQGTHLKVVEGGSVHTDYQEIKIQEAASNLAVGHIPRSLLVKLQHDLVDQCHPGDEVVVVGSLLPQWQTPSFVPDVECPVGMALSAHSIRVVDKSSSSAWKSNSGGSNSGAVEELDKFRKEFDAYWQDPLHLAHPIAARDFICKAVCPKLYGLQVIKLALLVTLIGGVSSDAYEGKKNAGDHDPQNPSVSVDNVEENDDDQGPTPFQVHLISSGREKSRVTASYYDDRVDKDPSQQQSWGGYREQVKTRRRDQSHLLLVGDPGTGKSQFLRFAAALCPRSVLTTGVGTTSAGLTCAAVREGANKEFALEAGALVLADKGVCCIDEFGCIRDQDRTTIHEAMEQQTLSVAKAGIVCKLNCRATIIAVMNPRDCLYDNHVSLSINTGLGTPLLSRFDLIFKLIDTSDAERDSNVTTYLLNRAIQGAGLDVADSGFGHGQATPWSLDKLRAYISVVKERFQPVMSDPAAKLLELHYEMCRSAKSNTIPVTVRFLESLIRLSQAHARLLYRNEVTLQDAVAVIQIMECSAFAYGGFDGIVNDTADILYCDPMTVDFSPEPDLDFLCFEYRILKRCGMLNDMDDGRRRKALVELGPTAASASTSWDEWEHRQVAPQGASLGWDQGAFPASSPGMVEDHYGRSHLSQPSYKRRRPS